MHCRTLRLRASLGAALLLGLAARGALAQGYSYTVKTTMQSPMMSGVSLLANAVGDASAGRLDIVQAMQPGIMSPGDYVIFTPEKMIFVYPAKREYSEVTPIQMAGSAAAMAGGTIKISNVKISGEKVGTETVAAHTTRHVRMTQDYTMGMDMMGMHQDATNHVMTDFWFADLPILSNPFTTPAVAMRDSVANSPLAELFSKTFDTLQSLGMGFALKQITTTTTSAMGNTMEIVQTTEISDLKAAPLDRSKLEVPAGFTKTEFRPGPR